MTAPVVVADDEADIRDLVAMVLNGEGYRVVPAADGEEVLARVGDPDEEPPLVLADLIMPHLSGWELIDRLRARGLRVPVVVMSAVPDLGAEARGHQADGYLVKPFDLDDLIRTVKRFIPAPAS